jgi:malonyl-ACP O-methyltransferase BioC
MKKKIIKSFSNRAHSYDDYSFIQKNVNERLLNRLNLIKHDKKDILEIGSGTGNLSQTLQGVHDRLNIVSIDLSHDMIKIHKDKNPHAKCIQTKAEAPPFKDESFDTILSSLTLHWCELNENLFTRYSSLLKPNGLLLFSAAGPDTFREFRKCPESIYEKLRFNNFIDMHHYGDFMLNANLRDPVVDSEFITLEFTSLKQLLKSLRFTGTNVTNVEQTQYINRHEYKIIADSLYNETSGSFELTYEIIFGYALKEAKTLDKSGKLIPIKEVKKE